MLDRTLADDLVDEALLDEYLQRPIVVENPCPHGIPAGLCEALCAGDSTAVATVHLDRTPGASLALDCELAGARPELLTDAQLLDLVEAAEKTERWASALRTRAIAAFADRHPAGTRAAPPGADPCAVAPVSRWLPDEVAMVLTISREEALGMITWAQRFTHVLPATLADWEAGRIDEREADAIAHATAVLDDDQAREVEAKILPGAADATRRQLQDRLRRAVAKADPEGAERRHQRAKADRRMSIRRGEDGMASLWLGGTAEQTEASWQSVDRLARALDRDDPRTLDQKRLDTAHQLLQGTLTVTDIGGIQTMVDDVLAAMAATEAEPGSDARAGAAAQPLASAAAAPTGPATDSATPIPAGAATDAPAVAGAGAGAGVSAGLVAQAVAQALAHKPDPNTVIGRKPLIHVVVGLDTLLGGDTPAELVGHGPIPALTARALAAGGVLQRLVVDPLSGALLDHGRTTYSAPAALDDHVHARDCTCRGPQCAKPIRDLDHHIPWAPPHEGTTSAGNLNGYCLGHHKLKDAPGWQVLSHPDGSLTWISPCGRRSITRPYDYRPFTDTTPDRSEPATEATGPTGSPGASASPADTPTDAADTDDVPPPF